MKAPKALQRPYLHQDPFGTPREDLYHWMRLSEEQKQAGRSNNQTAEVLDYLTAENKYTDHVLAHTVELQEQLYQEITGRMAPDDTSVPVEKEGYFYRAEYITGGEYPLYQRSRNFDGPFATYLDANDLAEGKAYSQLGSVAIAPDDQLLAFSHDTIGRRNYTVHLRPLAGGVITDLPLGDTTGALLWGDSDTLYYIKKDAALRPYQLWRYHLSTKTTELVYEEEDALFRVYMTRTKDRRYLLLGIASSLTTEYRYLATDDPKGAFSIFAERAFKEEYHLSHFGESWYIRTNQNGADNFKVMRCSESATDRSAWTEFIPYDQKVYTVGVDVTQHYFIRSVRMGGQTEVLVRPWDSSKDQRLPMPEESYTVYPGANYVMDSSAYRLRYTSMTTPVSTIEVDLTTGQQKVLKQQPVMGDFDKDRYTTSRLIATSHDGVDVPISIVHRKDIKDLREQPLLLYAYGSYGHSIDPYFSSARLSLLDRGVSFAIAHIRGGSEFGHHWYESGKFLHKKNTFHDFIACGRFLRDEGYCHPDQLFGMGGSAGGLLIGAVINMAPELWKGMVAAVPFVDVLSTMLDDSIPLTVGEYEEWGNPNDAAYYDYIRSYSPYDNISKQDYPAMLVTSGYHDSQVQYWEPTKWVAKLREYKTDDHSLLLHTNMEAGHSGASGRYRIHKETALEYAFILDQAGIAIDG